MIPQLIISSLLFIMALDISGFGNLGGVNLNPSQPTGLFNAGQSSSPFAQPGAAQTFGSVNLGTPPNPSAIQTTPTFGPAYNPPQNRIQGVSTQNTGGGGGGGNNTFPADKYKGWNSLEAQKDFDATGGAGKGQQPQAPDTSVFDRMIQPQLDNLEKLIGSQQDTSAHTETNLGTQRQTELDTQKGQFAGQERELGRQTTQQTDATNNAIEEAKRMYAEMSQGTLARYGTTTGTGGFLNEQLGQSTGRNIAQLHQGLQQHLQDINDKILQVKQTGELAVRGTNERFDQAIQTERDNLQKYVLQIKGQETMLTSNKAQMAYQAIQHYQDTVNSIEAQRKQQLQTWAIAQLNADTQLKVSAQRGQSAIQQIRNIPPPTVTPPPTTTSTAPAISGDQGSFNLNQLDPFQRATQ